MSVLRSSQGCSRIACVYRLPSLTASTSEQRLVDTQTLALGCRYISDKNENSSSQPEAEIKEDQSQSDSRIRKVVTVSMDKSKDVLKGVSYMKESVMDVFGKMNVPQFEMPDVKSYVPSTSDVKGKVNEVSQTLKTTMEERKKRQMAKKREKELEVERQALKAEKQKSFIEQMEDTHRSILEAYNATTLQANANAVPKTREISSVDQEGIQPKTESRIWGFNKFSWFTDPRFSFSATPPEAADGLKNKVAKKVVNKEYISKEVVDKRTKDLVYLLQYKAESSTSRLTRTQNLNNHLLMFPDSRLYAKKRGGIATLLRMYHDTKDQKLKQEVGKALALIGYCPPPRGEGIKILCIDGGGTKGLVAIQTLKELEKGCGKPLHKVFDYVCGVSTGSLILAIVFLFQRSIAECEELYIEKSQKMFTQGRMRGSMGLAREASFYNTELWEDILRDLMKEQTMIDFSRDVECPKFSALSCIANLAKPKIYMFRNHNLPPGVFSYYPGSCKYRMWECIRASSAAPGFYKPYIIDGYAHQDGGVLTNNPTAVAVHECKLLWPQEKIQCIVSLGNGRYEPDLEIASADVTPRKQFSNLIESAADTEAVHTLIQDMLPPETYFRFNPYISEDIMLNEINLDKLNLLQQDTLLYLRKNAGKVEKACEQLLKPRTKFQKCMDSFDLIMDKKTLEREEVWSSCRKKVDKVLVRTIPKNPVRSLRKS